MTQLPDTDPRPTVFLYGAVRTPRTTHAWQLDPYKATHSIGPTHTGAR